MFEYLSGIDDTNADDGGFYIANVTTSPAIPIAPTESDVIANSFGVEATRMHLLVPLLSQNPDMVANTFSIHAGSIKRSTMQTDPSNEQVTNTLVITAVQYPAVYVDTTSDAIGHSFGIIDGAIT